MQGGKVPVDDTMGADLAGTSSPYVSPSFSAVFFCFFVFLL